MEGLIDLAGLTEIEKRDKVEGEGIPKGSLVEISFSSCDNLDKSTTPGYYSRVDEKGVYFCSYKSGPNLSGLHSIGLELIDKITFFEKD